MGERGRRGPQTCFQQVDAGGHGLSSMHVLCGQEGDPPSPNPVLIREVSPPLLGKRMGCVGRRGTGAFRVFFLLGVEPSFPYCNCQVADPCPSPSCGPHPTRLLWRKGCQESVLQGGAEVPILGLVLEPPAPLLPAARPLGKFLA